MKCEICGSELEETTIETEISVEGRTFKAINVPAFTCYECYETFIGDSEYELLKAYAKHAARMNMEGDELDIAKADLKLEIQLTK